MRIIHPDFLSPLSCHAEHTLCVQNVYTNAPFFSFFVVVVYDDVLCGRVCVFVNLHLLCMCRHTHTRAKVSKCRSNGRRRGYASGNVLAYFTKRAHRYLVLFSIQQHFRTRATVDSTERNTFRASGGNGGGPGGVGGGWVGACVCAGAGVVVFNSVDSWVRTMSFCAACT